jgi:hypothetical protein
LNSVLKTLIAATLAASVGMAHAAGTASLSASGYSENFDSMGTSSTIANGWSVYVGASGTDKYTWETAISADDVANMIAASSALTVRTANFSSSTTGNNGFNAFMPGNTSDRLLATSPTSIAGTALQLTLQNDSGSSFSQLSISYDIYRFRSVSSAEVLLGYSLFYSLDGTSWVNATAFTPTAAQMAYDSTGVTTISGTLDLGTSVASGSTVYLRWIDDNGTPTSPDQAIGLNNVTISAVPEPESYAMLLAGLGLIGFAAGRRKAA